MPIKISKTTPNWNNLEHTTFVNLGVNWRMVDEDTGLKCELMGPDHWFEQAFRELFGKSAERTISLPQRTIYANPCGKAASDKADSEFIQAAKVLQQEWLARLRAVLGRNSFRVALGLETSPALRQLRFFGVLVIKGKNVAPRLWPRANIQKPRPAEHPRQRPRSASRQSDARRTVELQKQLRTLECVPHETTLWQDTPLVRLPQDRTPTPPVGENGGSTTKT